VNERVSVARILKTRGIRGEVAAEILTDFPERFAVLEKVFLSAPGKEFEEFLERYWFHKNRVILKFKGRDRPHEVEELVGCDVRVPASERVEAPEGFYFDSDLEGCQVVQNGQLLGVVDGILRVGESPANLIVVDSQDREFMIPLVGGFITGVHIDRQTIEVDIPAGLLELAVDRGKSKARE
jgi:16S rRNA processing protein RimM